MRVDYSGKTVVITGASGAIGSALCFEFAKNGANVAVCDIDTIKGQELSKQINESGGKSSFFYLDVTKREDIESVAKKIEDIFKRIDVLINNAGINVNKEERKTVDSFSDKMWDSIIDVNLNGTYNCTKAFVPFIKKVGRGNILNISSIVGLVPLRNQSAFAAAKAGIINLTKANAIELAKDNIRVNAIAPGSILFEGTKDLFYSNEEEANRMLANIPMHRPGSCEDVAKAALYLASCTDAAYVTGAVLSVDGGWSAGFARDY